ncbi:single-stranded DNA-binding protein [Leptothoe sp. LEGE 181152]|nr:single-stranded DNA-binding protein [Leptothoe sp. LEGE 181152]
MAINSVSISGGLKADPEMRYTSTNQKAVTQFTLAVTDYRNGQEETTWIDCKLWGKAAEVVAKHCKKGSKVCIYNAKLKQEKWTDRTTGNPRSKHVIEGNFVELIGGKPQDSQKSQPRPPAPEAKPVEGYNNQPHGAPDYEDVPF